MFGRTSTPLFAAALFLSAGHFASAQNLVSNPGFETGTFAGWDATHAPVTDVRTSGYMYRGLTYNVHSGTYFATLGVNLGTGPATLTQIIPTVSGQTYTVGFWLASDGLTPNLLDATFGATTILNVTNIPAHDYLHYSADVTATSNATLLTFVSQDAPGYLSLDDVSVVASSSAVPEPGSLALLITSGLTGAGLLLRRRRK